LNHFIQLVDLEIEVKRREEKCPKPVKPLISGLLRRENYIHPISGLKPPNDECDPANEVNETTQCCNKDIVRYSLLISTLRTRSQIFEIFQKSMLISDVHNHAFFLSAVVGNVLNFGIHNDENVFN
jgi:hypothetical protein